jgi:ABC-type protease/lipase transport system fused ATPase/permease subunit
MSDFNETLTQDARLVILRALHEQTDNRLNDSIIAAVLESYAHRRTREWIRQQLRFLADMDAIRIAAIGTTLVAELKQLGADHVERRTILEGVKRPSIGG